MDIEVLSCSCAYNDNSVLTVLYTPTQTLCESEKAYPQTSIKTKTKKIKTLVDLITLVATSTVPVTTVFNNPVAVTTLIPVTEVVDEPAPVTRTITFPPPPPKPSKWFFAPYKDVTQNMNWNTFQMGPPAVLASLDNITLAFATGKCGEETWAGIPPVNFYYPKPFILSTGGANGKFNCLTDLGFATFLGSYPNMTGIDFDLELDQSPQEIDQLLARLEKYPNLRKTFTLATLGGNAANNLNSLGKMVMDKLVNSAVQNWYVNLMTMNYGSPNPTVCTVRNGKCDMYESAVTAVESLRSFYNLPYDRIEVCPMIGVNDVVTETFTPENAHDLAKYATRVGLASIHFWSLDRDRDLVYTNIFKQYV